MNEPNRPDQTNPSTPLDENIERTAQQVSERHGLHNQASAATGQTPGNGAPPPLGQAGADGLGAIVSKSVQAVVRFFDGMSDRRLAKAAWRLTKDKGFVENIVREAATTDEEFKLFGELVEIIAAKHSLVMTYAPEVGAACIVAGVWMRKEHAIQALTARAAEMKKEANEHK
jgi:hypothetical protein